MFDFGSSHSLKRNCYRPQPHKRAAHWLQQFSPKQSLCLQNIYHLFLRGILWWGVDCGNVGFQGPLPQAIRTIYNRGESCFPILGRRSNMLSVFVVLRQGFLYVTSPDCDLQGQDFNMQPGGGEYPVPGPHNCFSDICRWGGSAGFIRPWLAAHTQVVCSRVWSCWNEGQHLQVWGNGSWMESS